MQRHLHDISQPQNLEFLQELRALLDEYPESTSVGEISDDHPLQTMSSYTSGNDKLHMAYTFDLLNTEHDADYIRQVIRNLEAGIGDGWPCWAISNHDVMRHNSRWGGREHPDFAKVTLAMLLSMRGSVCLYQGDELGLPEAEVPYESIQDPYGLPFWPEYKGRDGCRTPMVWESNESGGFSSGQPWLPVDKKQVGLAVDRQEKDSRSVLAFTRQFLAWRAQYPALIAGDIELLEDTGDMLCWLRSSGDQTILVAINMSENDLEYAIPDFTLSEIEGHGLAGCISGNMVRLPPFQAAYARVTKP